MESTNSPKTKPDTSRPPEMLTPYELELLRQEFLEADRLIAKWLDEHPENAIRRKRGLKELERQRRLADTPQARLRREQEKQAQREQEERECRLLQQRWQAEQDAQALRRRKVMQEADRQKEIGRLNGTYPVETDPQEDFDNCSEEMRLWLVDFWIENYGVVPPWDY